MDNQSHITLSMEQFNLLMGEVRDLKSKVGNIEAKTDNLNRIFDEVKEEPKPKRLSPKQQRAKNLKEALEKEKADMILIIKKSIQK